MQSYLRVKIKSLAVEATIIRAEERRVKRARAWASAHQEPTEALSAEFFGLMGHRKGVVRTEARAAQIAYAFLRGRPYSRMERGPIPKLILTRAAELANRYGEMRSKDGALAAVAAWAKA